MTAQRTPPLARRGINTTTRHLEIIAERTCEQLSQDEFDRAARPEKSKDFEH